MQNVSSDPLISGNSGFDLLKLYHFVGAFDLKETCYSLSKLKHELAALMGFEDTCCITKSPVLMSSIPLKQLLGNQSLKVWRLPY